MKLLALDLSTAASGWSFWFEGKLLKYGVFEPVLPKGHSKLKYPHRSIVTINSMVDQLMQLTLDLEPNMVLIEEIVLGGKGSMVSSKVLAGLHFVYICRLNKISNPPSLEFKSPSVWRSQLGLKLTEDQKELNKILKADNYTAKKTKTKQTALITAKDLAIDYVHQKYNMDLRLDQNDIADAICLGESFFL